MRNIPIVLMEATMLLFPAGSKAKIREQYLHHNKISLGYGILPLMWWMNMISDIFLLAGNGVLGGPKTRNLREPVALTTLYKYSFNKVPAVGGFYTYSMIKKQMFNADTNVIRSKTASNYHTVMPTLKVNG